MPKKALPAALAKHQFTKGGGRKGTAKPPAPKGGKKGK